MTAEEQSGRNQQLETLASLFSHTGTRIEQGKLELKMHCRKIIGKGSPFSNSMPKLIEKLIHTLPRYAQQLDITYVISNQWKI